MGILLCLFCPARPALAQHEVKQVAITSSWSGLGKPAETEVVVRKDGKSFRRGHQEIDSRLVASLASALEEKALDKPNLTNLGITDVWLKSMVSTTEVSSHWAGGAPNQRNLFVTSFTDVSFAAGVVPTLFDFVSFDDYPSVKVVVIFEDGSAVSASSDSQYLFMLPWKTASGDNTVTTFNADISRAVAALMPKDATNRSRIAGGSLANKLAEAVDRQIKDRWNLLGVENRAGDTLALLGEQYIVESADINGYHGVDFGKVWVKGGPQEINLQVTLKRSSFAKSFSDHAVLLYDGGKVYGAVDFLRTIGTYEDLVNSVPWLTRFSHENPDVPIQLVYVHDRSFCEKAMTIFAADMTAMGKQELVSEVEAVQDKVALLAAGFGGYWLVLPDRTVILWRYSTRAGLLQWAATDFVTERCSDYNTASGGCVGAVISPDGVVSK